MNGIDGVKIAAKIKALFDAEGVSDNPLLCGIMLGATIAECRGQGMSREQFEAAVEHTWRQATTIDAALAKVAPPPFAGGTMPTADDYPGAESLAAEMLIESAPESHRTRLVQRDEKGNATSCIVVARAPCCAGALDAWFEVTKEKEGH